MTRPPVTMTFGDPGIRLRLARTPALVAVAGRTVEQGGHVVGAHDPIRVLIVDDHSMVAESFRRALALEPDLEVVGVAATAAEARTAAVAQRPDVVLMDFALPDDDGVTAAAGLL